MARDDRGVTARLLSPVAEVRRGEAGSVLLMGLTMLLLLAAYYMLKTAREALILSQGGAEVKTYSSAGQAMLLLLIIPVFSALASRVARAKLVALVTLFFISNVSLFTIFGPGSSIVGVVYFIWVGIFNVMVVAQYWGFANDLYTPEQGKRLFPIVGLGSNLGAWLGSVYASVAIAALGPYPVMLIAAAVLGSCLLLAVIVHRRQVRHTPPQKRAAEERPLSKEGAFELIRRDRYLIYLAALTVVINVATTSSDYLFGRLLVDASIERFGDGLETAAARERFIGATYGGVYSGINLVSFLVQFFLVSRVFKYVGVANALFFHPLVGLAGYLLMMGRPSLDVVRWFKTADASLDYSLDNTARQALWLPTSREAKYKAKQAVDSFFQRVGDVTQAGIVFVGNLLSFGVPAFAALNTGLVIVWLLIVTGLRAMYREREQPTKAVAA
jgi:AAA family ATP:ADP antiporter